MSIVMPKRSERKYKVYTEYKDSGVEWLGQFPAHWATNRIKFTTYVKGRIGWHGLRSDEFCDEGPFLVTGTNFVDGQIEWNECYHISEERYSEDSYIHLREGDLLITKDGSIGKIAVVKNIPYKSSLNSGIFLTRPLNDIYITDFMYWVLQSGIFTEYIEYIESGSTIQHLYQKTFENFVFPIPSRKEQQAIAAFLDREIARIDELIDRKQRLIQLLQEQRTALITSAVTKGLNPDAPMKDSGIEWLGEIPAHWEVKKLKHMLSRNDGGVWGDDYDGNGTAVLRSTEQTIDGKWCIGEPAMRWVSAEENKRFRLISGDLLITKSSGSALHIGKATLVNKEIEDMNCCFSNFMQRLRLLKNHSAKYMYYVFNCILGREQLVYYSNTTTGLANLSSTIIGNIHVAIPNYLEQQAITEYLDHETDRIDGLIGRINQAIEKLQEYRSALITAAIIGKIDVRTKEAVHE